MRILFPLRTEIYDPRECTVSDNSRTIRHNKCGQVVSSDPKVPVERRRRSSLLHDVMRISRGGSGTPLRRESDQVRARLQRWIELADKALGKHSKQDDHSDSSAA
jgi:hypothetical protein